VSRSLSRRALLRGLGVGPALLPVLAARGRADSPPRRLICVAQTGGYLQPEWQPRTDDLLIAPLTDALAPLEPHRDRLLVLPALVPAQASITSRYGWMFHGRAETAGAFPGPAGPTLDQVVGAALGRPRASLALGVQLDLPPQLDPAPGYRHAFFTAPGAPVTPELDPSVTYARLFGGAGAAEIEPLLANGRSILDYVGQSIARYRTRLGSEDRPRLDLHLQAVRSLESRLAAMAGRPAQVCGQGPLAAGSPAPDRGVSRNYAALVDLQCDLLVAAFRCNATNVATLQLTDASGANLDPSFAGALPNRAPFTSWRDLARATDPASVAAKRRLDRWYMERFARLLTALQASDAPGGRTLLQETIVVWANDRYDGRTPEIAKVPMLVATGAWALPIRRAVAVDQPLAGALASLCQAMGVTSHPFGPPLAL
jgi:hypothetical protein